MFSSARCIAIVVFVFCLGAVQLKAAPVLPPKFSVAVLPPLPGQNATYGSSINNNGDVAGASDTEAVLWQNGSPSDLGPYLGGSSSVALSLNDTDQICCRYDAAGIVNSVIYYQGQVTPIDQVGGSNGIAYAINNKSAVAGFTFLSNAGSKATSPHAFVWQFGGTTPAVDIGTLGVPETIAFGINDSGVIVGLSAIAVAGSTKPLIRAFVYRDTKMNDLGALIHGTDSVARGINNEYAVCGNFTQPTGAKRGFVYHNGIVTVLKPVAGFTDCEAFAIGNSGAIVGRSYFDKTGRGRATIWINFKPYDLNLLAPGSSGQILDSAVAINDQGQIVADGIISGSKRGFVLTPAAN